MNVYDFDGTIYAGDSSVDLALFCLRRRPAAAAFLPRFAGLAALYRLGLVDKTRMKEGFFSFLRAAPATPGLLEEFWDSHEGRVKGLYLARRRADDLVVSASPEFLLLPICRRLGIQDPIGSRVDPATGRFSGENCRGEEKAARLAEGLPGAVVDEFYSDSLSDEPLARMALSAYLVRGEDVLPWPRRGAD